MNTKCPGCRAGSPSVVRNGRFYRADDARYIQRFKCRACCAPCGKCQRDQGLCLPPGPVSCSS